MYDEDKSFEFPEKYICRDNVLLPNGLSKIWLTEYPKEAEILEASIVDKALFVKIKYVQGAKSLVKYSFDLVAFTELTPEEK